MHGAEDPVVCSFWLEIHQTRRNSRRECTKKIVIRGDVHNKVLWQSLWLHWIEAGREEDGLSEEVQFMTF